MLHFQWPSWYKAILQCNTVIRAAAQSLSHNSSASHVDTVNEDITAALPLDTLRRRSIAATQPNACAIVLWHAFAHKELRR